jgi:hypothetical protein
MPFISDNPRLAPILKNLPSAARAKVTRIDQLESERIAKSRARADHARALQEQATDLQNLIARLAEDKTAFRRQWTESHEADFNERKEELAQKRQEIAGLRGEGAPKLPAEVQRRISWLQHSLPDFGDVADFLEHQSPFARFESAPAVVKSADRDALPKLLDGSRTRQGALIDEIRSLENAALDVKTILDAAMRDIDRMASAGKPEFRGLTKWISYSEHGSKREQGRMAWPMGSESNFKLTYATVGQLGTSFICWLLRDKVRAAFEEEIRALVGEGGPSITERTEKIAALQAKLLAEQRVFERLACQAEDAGLSVDRGIMHPLARLEIERVADAERPKEEPRHYGFSDDAAHGGSPVSVGKFQSLSGGAE